MYLPKVKDRKGQVRNDSDRRAHRQREGGSSGKEVNRKPSAGLGKWIGQILGAQIPVGVQTFLLRAADTC